MLLKARVDFKKPNIQALRRKGFTLVDMHFHSKYSDGITKLSKIMKRVRQLGIGIAITDHNEIKGCIEASKYKDIMLIPGIEATTAEGIHILLYFYKISDLNYFYSKYILKNRNKNQLLCLKLGVNELVDYAKESSSIVCAAHPFAIFWTGLCKAYHEPTVDENTYKKVDAIEVINASNMKSRNRLAFKFAEKNKKAITAGTDGHTLPELGRSLTYTKQPSTREEFLNALIKKTNFLIGKEAFIIRKAAAHSVKMKAPGKKDTAYIKFNIKKIAHYLNSKRKKGIYTQSLR